MSDIYDLESYNYDLPDELIAQYPACPRDSSRLLVLERKSGRMEDRIFFEIAEYLGEDDVLVLNDTRVIPARLVGNKDTGGRVEILLLKPEGGGWQALVRPARRVRKGTCIYFPGGVTARVFKELDFPGGRYLEFEGYDDWFGFLEKVGQVPLPPYIERAPEAGDKITYQTVYASRPGSAAAPTAGLHFTPELLARLENQGVEIIKILLHVGLGTFRPVGKRDIREHQMHSEYYEVGQLEAQCLNEARHRGKNIVAVGTTVVRTLESVYDDKYGFVAAKGTTDLFIYPGYRFRTLDGLITNFHLPKSSLLMLVGAFAGVETILQAYRHAVKEKYRFFSYGDAMFIR